MESVSDHDVSASPDVTEALNAVSEAMQAIYADAATPVGADAPLSALQHEQDDHFAQSPEQQHAHWSSQPDQYYDQYSHQQQQEEEAGGHWQPRNEQPEGEEGQQFDGVYDDDAQYAAQQPPYYGEGPWDNTIAPTEGGDESMVQFSMLGETEVDRGSGPLTSAESDYRRALAALMATSQAQQRAQDEREGGSDPQLGWPSGGVPDVESVHAPPADSAGDGPRLAAEAQDRHPAPPAAAAAGGASAARPGSMQDTFRNIMAYATVIPPGSSGPSSPPSTGAPLRSVQAVSPIPFAALSSSSAAAVSPSSMLVLPQRPQRPSFAPPAITIGSGPSRPGSAAESMYAGYVSPQPLPAPPELAHLGSWELALLDQRQKAILQLPPGAAAAATVSAADASGLYARRSRPSLGAPAPGASAVATTSAGPSAPSGASALPLARAGSWQQPAPPTHVPSAMLRGFTNLMAFVDPMHAAAAAPSQA